MKPKEKYKKGYVLTDSLVGVCIAVWIAGIVFAAVQSHQHTLEAVQNASTGTEEAWEDYLREIIDADPS